MRVLYLNPAGEIGGAERVLLDMIASLRRVRPEWTVSVIAGAEGPLVARATTAGARARVLAFPRAMAALGDSGAGGPAGRGTHPLWLLLRCLAAGPAVTGYSGRLRSAIREERPDVIHTNGLKMHLLAVRVAAGVPVIWHMHDYAGARPLARRLLRSHARRCALAIANSESVAEDLRVVCPGLEVRTLLNAVDLDRFSPGGPVADLDALAGLPPASPSTARVGLIATFSRWKGHEVFLRALAMLKNLDVRGYVIGGAVYQTEGSQYSIDELRALAWELGLDGRVGFTGFVEDTAAAMRALDIVAHTSTHPEPFGLVIAEAMACGRAVIVSEAGGAAEIATAGADCLTHRPGDAAELASRIAELAERKASRARLEAAARATAERRFDRLRLASDLIPIYQASMAG